MPRTDSRIPPVIATFRVAERPAMKDLIFVAVSAAFFVVSWLYATSFDRI